MEDGSFKFGLHVKLPRDIQTVPRSEIFSPLALADHLAPSADAIFIPDNLPFTSPFIKEKRS